jgi:peptide/nickel transport system substrate-binding protein
MAAHESLVEPWLTAKPKTDDRWLDWAYFEDVKTYNPIAEEGAVGWIRFVFDTFAKNNAKGRDSPLGRAVVALQGRPDHRNHHARRHDFPRRQARHGR